MHTAEKKLFANSACGQRWQLHECCLRAECIIAICKKICQPARCYYSAIYFGGVGGAGRKKKKGAHRTPADRCWTCLIVRIKRPPSCAQRSITSMRKKQLRPLCITFRPLSVFFSLLKLMYALASTYLYTKCGCALKKAIDSTRRTPCCDQQQLWDLQILSACQFFAREKRTYSHKLQSFVSFFAVWFYY